MPAAFVRVLEQGAAELKAAASACGWPCSVWAAGLLVPLVVGLSIQPTAALGVAFAGIVLQGVALIPVAVGLANLRRDHERQSLASRVRGSLTRIYGARLQPVRASVAVALGSATVSAHAGVADIRIIGTSVEDRLAEAERRLKGLEDRVEANARSAREAVSRLERRHGAQLDEHRTLVSTLKARTEGALVGGLTNQWVVVWWLVAATVMQAFPDSVASALPIPAVNISRWTL